MKYLLEVCLITSALMSTAAGQSAAPPSIYTPTLRKGISVKMPTTENAVTVPDADREDALVVVVTREGSSYLITQPITPSVLEKRIKTELRDSPDKKLYLKADARAPYADVLRIMETARNAGVSAPVLLTSQGVPPQPGRPVMPQGLEVLLGATTPVKAPIVIQLLDSGQRPATRINGEDVSWANLHTKLEQLSEHSPEKCVELKAARELPFADIVNVVDACKRAGMQVILANSRI